MSVVYRSTPAGQTGYSEYALNEATGKWYRRTIPYTRNHNVGAPTAWSLLGADKIFRLTELVNPDAPPETFSCGNTYRRERISVRLP